MTATRSYHHGNLRAALLEEAERALADGRDLSLRELAREVGVSHAAPRRHFADGGPASALAQDGFERLGAELGDALSTAGFDAQLHAMARTYVGFATRHAALLELMYTGKHRPGVDPGVGEAAERALTPMLDVIVAGQETGAVVGGPPEQVGAAVFAMVQGLAALVNLGMLDAGRGRRDGRAADPRAPSALSGVMDRCRIAIWRAWSCGNAHWNARNAGARRPQYVTGRGSPARTCRPRC